VSAAAIVILGAVFGGVIKWLLGERDRKVEGRASARIVGDTLTSALVRNYEPKQRPFKPVFIDYGAYAVVWETERKALARTMTTDDYATVSGAFDELRTIGKMEAAGRDLTEEVFDSLTHAAQACEFARRVTWRYSQSPRDRIEQWVRQTRRERASNRELRKLDRLWRQAREEERTTNEPTATG
jgi:hypothetical protein